MLRHAFDVGVTFIARSDWQMEQLLAMPCGYQVQRPWRLAVSSHDLPFPVHLWVHKKCWSAFLARLRSPPSWLRRQDPGSRWCTSSASCRRCRSPCRSVQEHHPRLGKAPNKALMVSFRTHQSPPSGWCRVPPVIAGGTRKAALQGLSNAYEERVGTAEQELLSVTGTERKRIGKSRHACPRLTRVVTLGWWLKRTQGSSPCRRPLQFPRMRQTAQSLPSVLTLAAQCLHGQAQEVRGCCGLALPGLP